MTGAMWRGVVLSLALGFSGNAVLAQDAAPLTTSAAAERAFTRAAARPGWAEQLPVTRAATAHGPYSVALSDVQIHLGDERAVYTRRAIEVHDATALQTVGRIDIDFLPDFQSLDLHGVTVIRDGRRLDRLAGAQVRFLQRETGLDQGIYTGAVTANVVVADLRVGDVLDIEYTIRGSNPVMGGKLFYSVGWDSAVYTGRRRVVLDTPDGRMVDWLLAGSDGRPAPAQRSEHRNGRTRLTFDAAAQPTWLGENHLPPEAQAWRWLQFSELRGWDELSRWAVALFPPGAPGADGPELTALLKRVRAAGTPEQQAVKALEFVQNEVRYLSVSIGQNSHRPVAPETVLQRRYGDCKDKSLLLATLLRRLGIDANVALLSTDMPGGLERLLPSPQLFDHAIVHLRLDGRAYLLDPTRQGQHGSLAQMGQPYRDHQFLLVAPGADVPGAAAPATLAGAPSVRPLSRRVELFELDQPGSPADLTVTRDYTGTAAEAMRVWLASTSVDERTRQFAASMAERYPDAASLGPMAVEDDRAANQLRLVSRLRIGSLFTRADQVWRVRFSAANLTDLFNKSGTPQRQYPLLATSLHSGDVLEYEFDLRLRRPAGVPRDSGKTTVSDPAFELQVHDETDPQRIHMRMRLRTGATRVAPAALSAYAQKLALLEQQLGGGFSVGAAAPPQAPAPVTTQTPQQQLEARLAQLDKAILDAGFRAADPSASLCERARTRQALGQVDAALKDAQQAVRLQPKAGAVLTCRADIQFAQRRFKEAESDYARAAALGADGLELFAARAVNAAYLGQPALAMAQHKLALAAADNDADRLRARIWLALLGADGQDTAASADDDARWLALVLDAVRGKARPEQALAAANGDAGMQADARLGETYFYLGKASAAKGERYKALAYFRQATAKLAPDHPHLPAARIELARIEDKQP